ncbi:PR domain zinc finger protein 2 [Pseudoliparis swirei]|uniref:PR domain zinc finger protein 2 n=1 Tax=Pseudoliparis swirei TaxID=2059687 RepID=UPI0024BE62A1|nr:PR domain zinc finger protein 2 [Pseudoliparis swirei]XP_056278834.1 PR domain zinc finger protein 2 [Pseudoliparis swirei]XP_056278835.1 PR domain zinc finger protein 2 [Pseudoliparis swirei]
MEDSPHLDISDNEDMEEGGEEEEDDEDDDVYQGETDMQPDTMTSLFPDLHEPPNQDTERDWNSSPCQHCERHFTSKQGLERHMHIHALEKNQAHACSHQSSTSFGSTPGRPQQEKRKPLDSVGSVMQRHTSSSAGSHASTASDGDRNAQPDKSGVPEGRHACKYCEKIFTTHTNKRRHELRIHEQNRQVAGVEKTQLAQETDVQRMPGEASQEETEIADNTAAVLENHVECAEQYMLDVSSNISENLSFYIDGMIVSTSTVGSCEAPEIYSGSSASVGLDALILDPAQISQVLNTDSVAGKEIPGQPQVKRRTATPPLLPQIKTELESEVGVSSSSSSLVSSFIENLLPPNTESTGVQKERTVFLSPKLKQLLENQDGLTPTLALIAEAQKPCSPVSLSVRAAGTGRFKRRTGSPPSSPQENPTSIDETADSGDCDSVGAGQAESQHGSPVPQTADVKDDSTPHVEEPAVTPVPTESWTPTAGGNSCNQQPLDLSNAVRRNEDFALSDSVLDLSFQKKIPGQPEPTVDLVSQAVFKAAKSNACMAETALIIIGEQNVSLGNPEIPLVTDFTILTGPDVMTPMEPVAEGLVYGLALPSNSLIASPASFPPVSLQPASPCTLECACPASHTVLPAAAASFITLLTPPTISNPASQPIPLLAPTLSSEPLVICTDGAVRFSECEFTTAFAPTDSANHAGLSQSLDPTLNLPAHVFLSDQIAISRPIVESIPMSEVQFTPTVSLSDSLINSFNMSSHTVLIECTIALEAPASIVPSPDDAAEPPAPTQMVVGHMERIVSVPNSQTVDATILMSSIAESVSLSTLVMSDRPAVGQSSPDPQLVVDADSPLVKEEAAASSTVSIAESSFKASPLSEKAEEDGVSSGAQPQTFTKNFICNVCDRLFHSMKELGHHVGDHADGWPYKCEFCVLLFGRPSALLDHRSSLHGVGKSYVCSACTKEFVYLCNLKQHQDELHPGLQCSYSEEEKGKLRPQNYNSSVTVKAEASLPDAAEEPTKLVKKEVDVAAEELFTTMKILASNGANVKGPDVRLGINQHYPSFKPPPFPYHNRSPAGSVASATNFTTHNIPQTFTTAIRCTKCGKSFDNMPELHKHILACANASDKRRYTPKRNPIPLRHFAKAQNGVLSTTNTTNRLNASNRPSQSNRSKPSQESPVKVKFKVLSKRKKKLAPRVMPPRNKSPSNKMSPAHVAAQQEVFVCPHCSREFTMRRSRTKHMAVCPKKPKEVKKRKEGGISVTKENDGRLHRRAEEKQQASPQHQTRLQSSGPAKRHAILPVQTVFSSKRSKIIIKESSQPREEAATLNELPMGRTFNPSMRQYSRAQHSLKGIPVGKPRAAAPQTEPEPASNSGQSPTA